jgi:hypothetical protein
MTRRTGSADLPLHTGRVPPWLASRMASLGAIVTQAIVHHYGRDEFMQRLSHPFWFQSFGAVMGMDWHSSGITTSVIGALKRGLTPLQDELGIYVCGGRGQHSRKTPDELLQLGDVFPELLLTPGVGARTVRSLAMVAEVVHGAPYRFKDPARFSLAHGGKDRHPYPVPIKVYDETIRVLKGAIANAKLGREEEMQAVKRLDDQARRLERTARGPSVEAYIAGERAASPELDGRSVFGWERDLVASKNSSGSSTG